MKIVVYYVLDCPCGYSVCIFFCLVPNYVVNCYRGVGKKVEGVLQRSFNESVRVYLYIVFHGICRLSDLEILWEM